MQEAAPTVDGPAPTVERPLTLPSASKTVYERRFGLPIVRQRITYSELLRDIRQGKVAAVHWFKDEWKGTAIVDGPCLVEYTSGHLRQANVPVEDVRIRYAMETHGVANRGLSTAPPESQLHAHVGFPMQRTFEASVPFLPFIAFIGIWVAVKIKSVLRGDSADRRQIRRRDEEDKAAAAQQTTEDNKLLAIQTMVMNDASDEEIRKELARMRVDITEEELQETLTESRRIAARVAAGKWSLAEEEEENVRSRRAELERTGADGDGGDGDGSAGDGAAGPAAGRLKGLRIRRARLRRVNRTRLKGKLKNVNDREVFFDDVAGIDAAKQELSEVVDFFNFPERYVKSGARAPRGCLLYGPPGTGKTLLARAVAGEAAATFLGVNASEFVEMFIGVGAARVRDLFQIARDNAPTVIFIDEIDAVGRVRGGNTGTDERDQTLNQMLSEMDGFDDRSGVVVIAATNRRDVLDPALIRPGRFDRQVFVGPPTRKGRVEVLRVHLAKFEWDKADVRLEDVAYETDSYTGAMLANLVNTAALMANRAHRTAILHVDFVTALLYEQQGARAGRHPARVTARIAAVEGASALAASLLPSMERVQAVYTQPSEKRRMGMLLLAPYEARNMTGLYTKRYLHEQLQLALAGRAAEALLFGPDAISTLNLERLNVARRIVQKLVLSAAMPGDLPEPSPAQSGAAAGQDAPAAQRGGDGGAANVAAIGPRALAEPLLAGEAGEGEGTQQHIGALTDPIAAAAADFEMERLLKEGEAKAYALLARNRAALDAIIAALVQEPFELTGNEVRALVRQHACAADLERLDAVGDAFL